MGDVLTDEKTPQAAKDLQERASALASDISHVTAHLQKKLDVRGQIRIYAPRVVAGVAIGGAILVSVALASWMRSRRPPKTYDGQLTDLASEVATLSATVDQVSRTKYSFSQRLILKVATTAVSAAATAAAARAVDIAGKKLVPANDASDTGEDDHRW